MLPLDAEKHELQAVADALAAVAPVSVLWKLTPADQQLLGVGNVTLSHNIRLIEWAPQNDVLGHPATRAFLTQAGTNSFNEVSCCSYRIHRKTEKKRQDNTFWCQSSEKPSIILGCPGLSTEHGFSMAAFSQSLMNSSPLGELVKNPN